MRPAFRTVRSLYFTRNPFRYFNSSPQVIRLAVMMGAVNSMALSGIPQMAPPNRRKK